MATWNIRDGRNTGLYAAARALKMMDVDVAVLQETKFTNTDFATRRWAGYDVLTAVTGSNNCGGIALLVKADERKFSVKNAGVVGPNAISCELITGSGKGEGNETRWFLVGFYSPPSDKEGTMRRLVEKALETRPK